MREKECKKMCIYSKKKKRKVKMHREHDEDRVTGTGVKKI